MGLSTCNAIGAVQGSNPQSTQYSIVKAAPAGLGGRVPQHVQRRELRVVHGPRYSARKDKVSKYFRLINESREWNLFEINKYKNRYLDREYLFCRHAYCFKFIMYNPVFPPDQFIMYQ